MNLAQRIMMARMEPVVGEVVLLLKGDGPDGSTNITDSSLYGHPVTVHGNAQISTAQSVYPGGSSMYFEPLSNVQIQSESFVFENDFTMECYVYILDRLTSSATFFSSWTDRASDNFLFGLSGTGMIPFFHIGNGNRVESNAAIGLSTWHHVAVSRHGGTIMIFIDGNNVGSTNSNAVVGRKTINPMVGDYERQSHSSIYGGVHGYIQNLRITKNLACYTTDFTPPTAPFPTPEL